MKGLSEKHRKRLLFIAEYLSENGRSPSYKEIAAYFDFSSTAAYDGVLALIKKGMLEKSEKSLRSISLPKEERMKLSNIAIPFFSEEPSPEELKERRCDSFSYIERRYLERNCFSFKVSSSSMVDAAILPGDTAIIAAADTPADGDIVLASCPGNDKPSELRRLKRIPGFTLLVPDNASMGTIKTTEAEILGVLVSIRREM